MSKKGYIMIEILKDVNVCCLSGNITGHRILPPNDKNDSQGVIAWLQVSTDPAGVHSLNTSIAFWGKKAEPIIEILKENPTTKLSVIGEFAMVRGEKYIYPQFKVYDFYNGKINLSKEPQFGIMFKLRKNMGGDKYVANVDMGEI